MSLNKAIEHGKEKRKRYYDSRSFDRTCRCHGSCAWCKNRRLHNSRKKKDYADRDVEEVLKGELE